LGHHLLHPGRIHALVLAHLSVTVVSAHAHGVGARGQACPGKHGGDQEGFEK
jgi:hypothetical protein